jgi:hypothetical protein
VGVSKSPAELGAKITKFANSVGAANRRAAEECGLMMKTSIVGFTKAATGGDQILSGTGRKRAKLGARYDVKGYENATVLVRALGWAFPIVERGAKPHPIGPRGVRGRRARAIGSGEAVYGRHEVLKLGNGVYRRWVDHPGAAGKHPFEMGVRAVEPKIPAVWQRWVRKSMADTFT